MAVASTVSVPQEPYGQRHCRSTTLDSSVDGVAPGQYVASHSASTFSQSSSYDYSFSNGDSRRDAHTGGHGATRATNAKPRWLKSVKNWLSVSEPSAQALKHQRHSTYQRYGIDFDDPDAAAKMHLPIGKVPEGVTTSTAGPEPEKALREKARRNSTKQQYMRQSGSQSRSSGISSDQSLKEAKKIAPWVE